MRRFASIILVLLVTGVTHEPENGLKRNCAETMLIWTSLSNGEFSLIIQAVSGILRRG